MAELKVILKDETSQETSIPLGNTSTTPHKAVNSMSPKTNEVRQNRASHKAIAVASMLGQQSFSYIASNIGTLTGSKQKQQKVDNAMQLASIAGMSLVSPGTAAATVGIQLATTAVSENNRKQKETVGLAQARARAGYTNDNAANYRRR